MLQAYPPVPNWYTSHCACVVNSLNYYVYASRNAIVVMDLATFAFVKTFLGAMQRINAIAAHEQFCYIAEGNRIRTWNLIDSRLLIAYKAIHKNDITVIQCIRGGTTLVSGDKSGTLVLQLVSGDQCWRSEKVNSEIKTIAPMCHAGQDYLAIAYANGMIYIEKVLADLKTETVYQMTHANVNNLAWQYQEVYQATTAWPLLASSTRRNREIFIWNVPSESKHAVAKIPAPSPKWTEQQRNTLWIELAWSPLEKDRLWVSSYMGNIISFKINNGNAVSKGRLPDIHSRIAFSLIWVDQGHRMVSYGLDKQIVYWDMHDSVARVQMVTQAAFPYSIDISAWNPGQAAVGIGDANIKIWQFLSTMTSGKDDFYQASVMWKEMQGQIRHVRWHPTQDNKIAYSNEYGRIGVYDISKIKNMRFKGYHDAGTVTIAWAGDLVLGEHGVVQDTLISCGVDGKILVFHTGKPHFAPVLLEDILAQANPAWSKANQAKVNTKRCIVDVDPKYRFLAIGNTDGVVEVYRLDTLKIIYVCNALTVNVTAMAWGGKDQSYLAVGYRSGNITIHKISIQDNLPEIPIPDSTALHKSDFHKKPINCLSWSHHVDKMYLASASEDDSVGVFAVNEEKDGVQVTPEAHFKQHRGRVLTVCWGYEDTDVLISGAEDRFIYLWKWTDYLYPKGKHDRTSAREKELAMITRSPIMGNQSESTTVTVASSSSMKAPTAQADMSHTDIAQHAKKKRRVPNALMIASRRSQQVLTQDIMLRRSLLLAASIYGGDPLSAIEHVKSKIPAHINPSLYDAYVGSPYEGDSELLDLFFGDKNDMRRLLDLEESQMAQVKERSWPLPGSETFDLKLALDVIRSSTQESQSSSNMIDWVALALSPTAGKEAWLAMMENTATQLARAGQTVLAATCYLACSKVYDAINVYRKAKMYREAIALAKIRLPPIDPLIPTLYAEWGDLLKNSTTEEEFAAMCFIKGQVPGSTVQAINLLARKQKDGHLFWAACLACLLNDSTADERISQYIQALEKRATRGSGERM